MKRIILIFTLILCALMLLSSCSDTTPEGNVNFGDYVIPTEPDTTKKYDDSQLINADNSWQTAYALSYDYYDKKTGASTITEGKFGNYYQSIDKATNIVTFLTQEDGYMIQYMLDDTKKTGTSTVITDGSIDSMHSGFMLLSVCDPYFPVYKNVTKVGDDFVGQRSATRYKQVQTENGVETQIAYVWVDDMFGFASRCELYDAQTEELLMKWELTDFTQNVNENGVKINLDDYNIVTE